MSEHNDDSVVEQETVTETVTETTTDEPSTAAQDVVNEVHESQAEDSNETTVASAPVEEGANPSPPAEGTTSDD